MVRCWTNQQSWYVPKLGLNFGIAQGWEFIVEGEWERPRAAGNNTKDNVVALGVKKLLREGSLQGNSGLSVATEFTVVQTQSNGSDTGAVLALIIGGQWDWGAMYFNVATEQTPADEEELFLGIIIEGSGASVLRPVAELSFGQDFNQSEELAGLLGFIYEPTEALAFDFGLRRSHGDEGSETEFRLGVTFEFPGS